MGGYKYILDRLEKQGDRKTDRLIYSNAILFHAAVLINAINGKAKKYNGKNITFYGLTLAGSACVSGDTEFMTENGWKKISDFKYGDKVLEIEKDTHTATFREPIRYIKEFDDKPAIKYVPNTNSNVSMHITEDHTVLYLENKNDIKSSKAKTAKEVSKFNNIYIPSLKEDGSSNSTIASKDQIVYEQLPNNTKYCFTTKTGFWLARHDNFVFITGNCGKDFSYDLAAKVFGTDTPGFKKGYVETIKTNLRNNLVNDESISDELKEVLLRYVPQNVIVDASGTKEGLYSLANAISLAQFGSVNLISNEIGDEVAQSTSLLNMLKQLYDGKVNSKIIKSESMFNVESVSTNVLLFGSNVGFDLDSKKKLIRLLSSGMLRRSIVVEVPIAKIERNMRSYEEKTKALEEAIEYGNEIKQTYLVKQEGYEDYNMEISDNYLETLEEIKDTIIEDANNNLENQHKMVDVGSVDLIENVAHLIAFMDLSNEVNGNHLIEAFKLFTKTRETIKETLSPLRTDISIYNLLKLSNKKMSLMEIGNYIEIPDAKTKRMEIVDLFREYTYHKGFLPKIIEGNAIYLEIKEPEKNTLDKIICSIDVHDYECRKKEAMESIAYAPLEIPFFGESKSAEALITSNSIKSFTCSWFEESKATMKCVTVNGAGHRGKEYYIMGNNMIAFDVDDGTTLKEAFDMLKEYTYLIYTTKSHRKEKHGEIQGDRFRILIPTKNKYYVDPVKYKKLHDNVADVLGLKIYDKATTNVSRMWFTNPEAEVYKNEAELFDVSALIPETEKAELVLPLLNSIENSYLEDNDEYQKRRNGFIKHFLTQAGTGNRNIMLHKAFLFFSDLGADAVEETRNLNTMLLDPVSENEIAQITRTNQK